MNTKEKKLELVKELRETLYELEVYQDQPWTFVKFLVLVEGTKEHTKVIKLFGFSKVCHPDEWDADYGVELAITKALYKLAKEILSK